MSLLELYKINNQSGNYHLGQMFMDCMRSKPPEDICQIDAATGEEETFASVRARSVRMARAFVRCGLRAGDVVALGGRNHLDLHIPYYGALLVGLPILGVDPFFKYDEIKLLFQVAEPKIAFCQREMYENYKRAANELGLDIKIVTFDDGECTLSQFLEKYGGNEPTEDFEAADFDTDKVYAWLVSTSGTTGMPKVAAFKHQSVIDRIIAYANMTRTMDQQHQSANALNLSPVQWISGYYNAVGIFFTPHVKLQTSTPDSLDHVIDVINKYKPVSLMSSPSTISQILTSERECDLTSFNIITLTGSKIYKDLLIALRSRMRKDAVVLEAYGQTETAGPCLMPNPRGPLGACGVPMPEVPVKLVDPDTFDEIVEPNVPGELWTKGPSFACYYNNPEETAKAFTDDGWYRTGDLLFRDDNNNFYFVDRIKLLIKYRNYHVNPPELEEVINSHPGVHEVAVTGVPHPQDGQRPAACVVRAPGATVTAEDIKNIVAEKLSSSKQLRGGVVFVDEIPKTSTGKVVRAQLNKIVLNGHRE